MSEEIEHGDLSPAAEHREIERHVKRTHARFSRMRRDQQRADFRALRELVDMERETRDRITELDKSLDAARDRVAGAYAYLETELGSLEDQAIGEFIMKVNVIQGPTGLLAHTLREGGDERLTNLDTIKQATKDWATGVAAWGEQLNTHEHDLNLDLAGIEKPLNMLRTAVDQFVEQYLSVLDSFLDLLETEELRWFYEDLNVARLWEIERARIMLHMCRGMTGLTFSVLAELADVAKSTVTRFMATPVPRYVIRDSSLLKIVQATSRQLDQAEAEELGWAYEAINTSANITGDFSTIDDMVDYLVGHSELKSDWFTWAAAQAEADRIGTTGVLMRQTDDGPEIVWKSPRHPAGSPPARIVEASASAKISISGSAVAEVLTPPGVHIVGDVAAGVFQEAHQRDEDDWEFITLPDGYGEVFGLRVRGDSMDKEFPDGSVLICKHYNEADDEVPLGKYVIADRIDGATGFIESTCKRLTQDEKSGTYILLPESTNPVHMPLPLLDMGEQSVRVRAVVTGAILKF